MDVAQNGRMAIIGDPGQATIGVWQPGTQNGFELRDEVGTASWFELFTRDYDASVAFYRDVFGWNPHTMSDSPEFRYTTLGEGDSALAGIMDATQFCPKARRRRGRSTSRSRTPTPRSSRSSSSEGRSSGRPRTRRTAGSLRPRIPPARR